MNRRFFANFVLLPVTLMSGTLMCFGLYEAIVLIPHLPPSTYVSVHGFVYARTIQYSVSLLTGTGFLLVTAPGVMALVFAFGFLAIRPRTPTLCDGCGKPLALRSDHLIAYRRRTRIIFGFTVRLPKSLVFHDTVCLDRHVVNSNDGEVSKHGSI